jgi:hypothetical protein
MSDPPTASKRWLCGYVLHNLTCKEPLESDYLAIVPASDSRVQEIVATSRLCRNLVENITDQYGHKREPSVLVIREDAPERVRHIDAVVSFRNLIAISCVVLGWQKSISSHNPWGTLYADYFDFYPTTIMSDGKYSRTISAALIDFGKPNEIHPQSSPGLPSTDWWGAETDEMLLHPLAEAWNDLYVGLRHSEREATALFRSLQVAYLAAGMPISNEMSIHDWGSRIALWISACEILAHPAVGRNEGNSGFVPVKDLLKKQVWSNRELRENTYNCRNQTGKIIWPNVNLEPIPKPRWM